MSRMFGPASVCWSQQACALPQLRNGFLNAVSRGNWWQLERYYEGIITSYGCVYYICRLL